MFEHACFMSFPRDAGNASTFADEFYDELVEQLHVYDKHLSIFKFDKCESRRRGDDWSAWIERELCHSAMMVAVCAPAYFSGSAGCVSEFEGMELLVAQRSVPLAPLPDSSDWIVGLRLKDGYPLPRLKPQYPVLDFFDCCTDPRRVRRVMAHKRSVEKLADRIWNHWTWVSAHPHRAQLQAANICGAFKLPASALAAADSFPYPTGVR